MDRSFVAGICVERDGATVVVASHPHLDILGKIGPEFVVEAVDYRAWPPNEKNQAIVEIEEIARELATAFPELRSVAVACFGPFVSLMRTSPDYGRVSEAYGNDPLKNVNLYATVRGQLLAHGMRPSVKVSVHTDANAFTMGEAINRRNERNHVLVGILATEGVGGGIVTGNSTFQSALHPEMGLVSPRFDKDDPLKPDRGDRMYAKSIGELASNEAMRDRFAIEFDTDPREVANEDLQRWRDPRHWDFRSYYLAQLCLTCASLLTPHQIVLAADLDPRGALISDVKTHFDDMVRVRKDDEQPMLAYPQLGENFISPMTGYRHAYIRDFDPQIGLTGALGGCLLAARVNRGGPQS